ncbi:proactivator polypeptide-like 1 [Melospiza melodia melodia]|uniref:proactivator polypeptide-like 1 n=1 Tax=Melospiza melodia melodia TaxID=1914991 RepID=UPI002FD4694F
MAPALPLLLALLGTTPGLGAPGGGCGVPPSAWCQDWVTALRCGALGRCPRLGQGPLEALGDPLEALRDAPDLDACAVCQQLLDSLRHISSVSAVEVVLDDLVGLACPHILVVESLCKRAVNDLVHRFLQNMQHLDSWSVCAKLTLCREEPGVVPVLEGPGSRLQHPKNATVPALSLSLGPCALGPIFWCSGPEAARRCQAVQHCKDHVWL